MSVRLYDDTNTRRGNAAPAILAALEMGRDMFPGAVPLIGGHTSTKAHLPKVAAACWRAFFDSVKPRFCAVAPAGMHKCELVCRPGV